MTGVKIVRRGVTLAAAVGLVLAGTAGLADASSSTGYGASTVYSSLPNPLKANEPSEGFEAYSLTGLGDDATLNPGGRSLTSVTLGLSSWGCESGTWYSGNCVTTPGATFSVPMTLTVYGADDATVLASSTQTFAIPYRPSASPQCSGGRYYDNQAKQCFNGLAVPVTFPFTGQTLPDSIVWRVEYNTTHFGPNPIGEAACVTSSGGCGYDSLNVLLHGSLIVGLNPTPDDIWISGPVSNSYCDGGAGGLDVFRLDVPAPPGAACWTGYYPAIAFKTSH